MVSLPEAVSNHHLRAGSTHAHASWSRRPQQLRARDNIRNRRPGRPANADPADARAKSEEARFRPRAQARVASARLRRVVVLSASTFNSKWPFRRAGARSNAAPRRVSGREAHCIYPAHRPGRVRRGSFGARVCWLCEMQDGPSRMRRHGSVRTRWQDVDRAIQNVTASAAGRRRETFML
jgi:hypothetical protein